MLIFYAKFLQSGILMQQTLQACMHVLCSHHSVLSYRPRENENMSECMACERFEMGARKRENDSNSNSSKQDVLRNDGGK